jgi:hypothetical protein
MDRLTDLEQAVLRELAVEYAAVARLPVQNEKRSLWRNLNRLQMIRPMVAIDQLPWHELEQGDELRLQVNQPFWRSIEQELRQTLYKWRHFPADMVIEPVLAVPKAYQDSGYGFKADEEIARLDARNSVVGHAYHNQIRNEADLERLRTPTVTLDYTETARREEEALLLFDGIIPIRLSGITPSFALWDRLAEWMGAEGLLYDLADRPEFIHAIMRRFTAAALGYIDNLEAEGLFDAGTNTIHCSYNYSDELPGPDYDPARPRAANCWTMGMAQIFSTVSPAMHDEFEIDYLIPVFQRFGLVYYGCCEPLHDRIDIIRRLPHVRKISCSPWCDVERAAAQIGSDYVLSRKPAPSFLAADRVDWQLVRDDLQRTRDICARYATPLEYILKDVSTVRYEPQRLTTWHELAQSVVCS